MLPAQHFPFIGNQYRTQVSGLDLLVYHKHTNELLARIPQIGLNQVEEAIASTISGFQEMRKLDISERAAILQRIRDLLDERKEDFIQLIVAEAGKPISFARQELERCLLTIDSGIREVWSSNGEQIPMNAGSGKGKIAFTQQFPTGPVLGISPFNFPLNLALHKIVPALAVGTSILLKAPPQAPLSVLGLAGLIAEAGAPAGAVNVIVCDIPVAEKLVSDPRFSVLSFTGSARVGWHLMQIAGNKKVLLELGGNAPVIVDETADLAEAARQIARGAFLFAGQICISTQRIYVVESVADEFRDLLLSETSRIRSGDPSDEYTINGPIIDANTIQRIQEWLQEANRSGAEILAGGNLIDAECRIFSPTILTHTTPEMKLVKEEVFAPIAIFETIRNLEQGVDLANASEYGLQCGVFSNHLERIKYAYQKLEYGAIIINSAPGFRVDQMPYGGIKSSGLGREGIRYAMEAYTEKKLLVF